MPAINARSILRERRPLRLASWILAVAMVNVALAEVRSPFEETSAIQRQLRLVAENAVRSVFAVTAFSDAPSDPSFYSAHLTGPVFARLAERRERSCGSAFAIDAVGHLITNEHVVSGASSVWVTDDTGHVLPAVVIGTDPRTDLAILAIPCDTKMIPRASKPSQRGDLVVAIGNPDGLATDGNLAVSVGSVSAVGRSLPTLSVHEGRSYSDLLQVTTPIAIGGSGGPLVDLEGGVVGIVSAVAKADRDDLPVGFAIALSPTVRECIARLLHGEEVTHPYFGLSVSAAAATEENPASIGAHIDRVESDGPADGVLRPDDVIVAIDGRPVMSDRAFLALAAACPVDVEIQLRIQRDGVTLDMSVRTIRRPSPANPVIYATQRLDWAGVTFANDAVGVRVTAIASDATMPLKVGAVVRRVDGESVPDVVSLARRLYDRAGAAVSLDVVEPE